VWGLEMNLRIVAAFFVSLGLVFPLAPAVAEHRVALVIGNGTYESAVELSNTKNDATDIAAVLKALGFDVSEGIDLTKAAMDDKIREFADTLSGADAAVFYYAGHALQVGGVNYLVPVDARLKTSASLDWEMVRLDLVQRTMERETKSNILFLDACRDNPLARNLARAMGTRSGQIGRGLAAAESGFGTLISYSTQPGNVALDGTGRNSPYASALVKNLPVPGKSLSSILIDVRNDVMQQTGGKQVPWEHSALTGQFFFKPAVETSQAAQSPAAAAPPLALSEETRATAEELSALKKRLAQLEENMMDQRQENASKVDEMTRLKEKLAHSQGAAVWPREAELQRDRQSALSKRATAPTDIAKLKNSGLMRRGWLGVKIQNVDGDTAASLGLKENKGALVSEVIVDGPAAKAGLRVQDAILEVNGSKIEDSRDLARRIAGFSPNTTVNVKVWRNNKEKTINVKLGKSPNSYTK